jgi:ketosteroid isomerase-like protein
MSENGTRDHSADEAEIRRVHAQWWRSNKGLDIEMMRECFAPQYLMFNLNGHPYFSLDEKVALFRHYQSNMVPTEPVKLWDVQVTVDGDMAYVTAEGILPITLVSDEGSGSATLDAVAPLYPKHGDVIDVRFRETSVFRRDDGHGNPQWRIWHFHCSPLAPEDEPRPGFGDTAAERGTGPAFEP